MDYFFTPSLFRKSLGAVLVLAALAFIFSFTVDLWVQRKLPFIETAISQALKRPVEIRRAGYTLYHGFILDDFTVKEIKTVPVPFTVQRVRAIPSFELFPAPAIRIHRLIFVEPRLAVEGRPGELLHAGSLVRALPAYRAKVGSVVLEMKLSAFLIERGRVSIFAKSVSGMVRQEFERIDFFAGSGWFNKNTMKLRGRIAGKPEAHFRVESDIFREARGALNSNIRVELHEFTTSYLAPYLKDYFKMPDRNLTAAIRFKIRDGKKIESAGQFDMPSIGLNDRLLQYLTHRSPKIRYFFAGSWAEGAADLSKIYLKTRHARLIGSGRVDLSEGHEAFGFSMESGDIPLDRYKKLFKPLAVEAGTARIAVRLSGTTERFDPELEIIVKGASLFDAKRSFVLSKADGRLRVSPRGVELDEVWAFANDLPFRFSGRLSPWTERPSLDLEFTTFPGQLPSLKEKNHFNGSMRVRAFVRDGLWSGYARGHTDDYPEGRLSRTEATIAFKNASLEEGRARWLLLRNLKTNERIFARNFSAGYAHFRFLRNALRWRMDILDSRVQRGRMNASVWMSPKERLWKARAAVTGADLQGFSRSFLAKMPADGKLSLHAQITGQQNKTPSARVVFNVREGSIGPNASLTDWASQTGIEALRSMRFDVFSGRVFYRAGLWRLERLLLIGDRARLEAALKVRDGRVNGRLSVRFPSESIRPKSDLSWLMEFARQTDWIDFDFHVAGAFPSPRIEWLAGEFKKKIESRLSPWMRNELARRIEQRFAV